MWTFIWKTIVSAKSKWVVANAFFLNTHIARFFFVRHILGVSLEHEWVEIVEAFKRMEAGLLEQYKACRR
jgi:hypothetical protein